MTLRDMTDEQKKEMELIASKVRQKQKGRGSEDQPANEAWFRKAALSAIFIGVWLAVVLLVISSDFQLLSGRILIVMTTVLLLAIAYSINIEVGAFLSLLAAWLITTSALAIAIDATDTDTTILALVSTLIYGGIGVLLLTRSKMKS